MKHELTQRKCFVPDTPSFYDHIWIFKHKMMLLHSNVSRAITLSSNESYLGVADNPSCLLLRTSALVSHKVIVSIF